MNITASPYSTLKIFHHMELMKKIERGERTAPIYMRIKPTNYCNHHCSYCSYADRALGLRDSVRQQDQIPWKKLQEIIRDMQSMGVRAVTFSGGGEPLLYPHIVEAMNQILDASIDLSIISNGQLLQGERAEVLQHAKWVRVSCDAANNETYAAVRGLPENALSEVCKNLENFASRKTNACELGINFVIHHENYREIYPMAEKMKAIGVDHIKYSPRIVKDLFAYHAPFQSYAMEQLEKAKEKLEDQSFHIIDKYASDFDTAMVFQRTYHQCYIHQILTVIGADSKVYFCHDKAYVSHGVVADLSQRSFREIWYDPKICERYQNFDAKKECSHHCIYDDRNLLLNTFFHMDQKHVNFI